MSMLPMSMQYAARKVPAVQASSILRSFSASNGTTFNTSTNEIRIPVNCDGFLDGSKSYLQFTINNSGGNTAGLDPYGLCWCDQLRIESNGQVLERVERAGVYDTLRRRWTKGQKAISPSQWIYHLASSMPTMVVPCQRELASTSSFA